VETVGMTKTALVTGPSSGVGRLIALTLARQGWTVALAGPSMQRLQPVLDAIRSAPVHANGHAAAGAFAVELDLGHLDSVRRAAGSVMHRMPALDLLVNNAGVAGARGLTASGFEAHFGVNHVGHFSLTRSLWPALERAGSSRVVTVASRAHYMAKAWNWDALGRPTRTLSGIHEYAISKLANILFCRELARRGEPLGIASFSLHPGVLDTRIWRSLPAWLQALNRLRLDTVDSVAHDIMACVLEAPPGESGAYYSQGRAVTPSRLAQDAALAAELWDRSLKWTD